VKRELTGFTCIVGHTDSPVSNRQSARFSLLVMAGLLAALLMLSACGSGDNEPTRTPIPTWTPTPAGVAPESAQSEQQAAPVVVQGAPAQPGQQAVDPTQIAAAMATDTPTPTPLPSETPTPQPTATPSETPTMTPTPLPSETPTPLPSETPTPELLPTPTPEPLFSFVLESAEKFPTESLAPNVVRIYAYIYSPEELGLGNYSLKVQHNGMPLVVDELSTAGLPEQTRTDMDPYTRFTNFNVVFVEPQAGEWRIQLVDPQGVLAGTEAIFTLTADENTRELYVRYVKKAGK